jgi:hypothetical protein
MLEEILFIHDIELRAEAAKEKRIPKLKHEETMRTSKDVCERLKVSWPAGTRRGE